jgi:hypothetical protein
MGDFAAWEFRMFEQERYSIVAGVADRAQNYWRFFFGWLFSLPLIVIPWIGRDRPIRRLLLAAVVFFLAALSLQVWKNPHYAAPATGLFFLIVTLSLERLREVKPVGVVFVRALLPLSAFVLLANSFASDGGAGSRWLPLHSGPLPAREQILRQLTSAGGKHLVLVRYGEDHNVHEEWVYNAADIDSAAVVWARDLGPERNQELLDYFQGRQIWIAEPEEDPILHK